MYKLFLTLLAICISLWPRAQTPDSLFGELRAVNSKVAGGPYSPGRGDLISNRAMNIFLSNKIGSYLSESDNLSLYKNSINFNSADGTFGLNHNLYTVKGVDDRVRSLPTIGVKANAADAFAAAFTGRQFDNQFGFFFKQTWIAKTRTSAVAGQKQAMDALRAAILHTLEGEIRKKAADFEMAVNAIDPTHEVPGQDPETAKKTAREKFYADLQEEYEYKFALLQSGTLAGTFNYKVVSAQFTSVSLYLPLIREKFEVAPSLTGSLADRHGYPLHFNVSHTRLWESSRYGRFFLTVSGEVFWNNSKESYALTKTSFADYKGMGGSDTLHAGQMASDEVYIGDYANFFTPLIKGQFIYIPPNSHVGVSFLLEQNFGFYDALNARLGVPIVLINKKAEPAINFEVQIRYFDIGNKISPAKGLTDKTSIGVSLGVPFSRIAF